MGALDAQRLLFDQQDSPARDSSSSDQPDPQRRKALGGGWETRRDRPVIPEQMQDEQQRTDWGSLLSTACGQNPPKTPKPESARGARHVQGRSWKRMLREFSGAAVALVASEWLSILGQSNRAARRVSRQATVDGSEARRSRRWSR